MFLGLTVDDSSPVRRRGGPPAASSSSQRPHVRHVRRRHRPATRKQATACTPAWSRSPAACASSTSTPTAPPASRSPRTEEWPETRASCRSTTSSPALVDGRPDCLVIRRDSFGDEAANKNFTSLADGLSSSGGTLGWDVDLGGLARRPARRRTAPPAGSHRHDPTRASPPSRRPASPKRGRTASAAAAPRRSSSRSTTTHHHRCSAPPSSPPPRSRCASPRPWTSPPPAIASAYLLVNEALRALPMRSAAPLGDRVRLRVEAPDLAAGLHAARPRPRRRQRAPQSAARHRRHRRARRHAAAAAPGARRLEERALPRRRPSPTRPSANWSSSRSPRSSTPPAPRTSPYRVSSCSVTRSR